MDDGAAATRVNWRKWEPAAFERADRAGKPILLSLVTPWSAECREMDETTYTDPAIAANVNDGFVPVRVDADRHPRVRERYNMGGFPSTVFLTPSGSVLSGATFLGVDGFRGILDSVRRTWDAKGETAGSIPRGLGDAAPPAGEIDGRVEEHMVEQLLGAFDEEFGGWGADVKFPMPRTIEFALVRARDQATRTLEAVRTHLLDTYEGGFYRYARDRDWGGVRREKLTDENAALVRAFAHAYRYTGEDAYRDAAEQTVSYLTTTCWTGEAVAGSQGGDEAYFRLESTEREAAATPPVDGTVFADRNGLAVDGLLTLARFTDDETATRYARRARDFLAERLIDDAGRVTHYYAGGDESGDADSAAGESTLLLDQARVLTGLTTSWSVLGEPGPAPAVADRTIEALQADHGAFRDGPAEGAGLLDRPAYPIDPNVEVADALLDLALLSGDRRYAAAARDAIAAFAGAAERMGVEVAAYAAVAARLRSPTAVEVGPPAGSDLHRAALRLADHEAVVVPDATDGPVAVGDRTGKAADPVADDRARLVVDGDVEGTASDPAGLEELLTG